MKKILLLSSMMAIGQLGICQELAHPLGSVPKQIVLKTDEACRAHFEEAYNASLYYVSHYNIGDDIEACRKVVIDYAMNSKDMVFSGGPMIEQYLEELGSGSRQMLAALMAGYIIYMHDHPEEDHVNYSENAYVYGFSSMLDYYQSNLKHNLAVHIKTFDSYIKTYNKSKEKYLELLKKDYSQKK